MVHLCAPHAAPRRGGPRGRGRGGGGGQHAARPRLRRLAGRMRPRLLLDGPHADVLLCHRQRRVLLLPNVVSGQGRSIPMVRYGYTWPTRLSGHHVPSSYRHIRTPSVCWSVTRALRPLRPWVSRPLPVRARLRRCCPLFSRLLHQAQARLGGRAWYVLDLCPSPPLKRLIVRPRNAAIDLMIPTAPLSIRCQPRGRRQAPV